MAVEISLQGEKARDWATKIDSILEMGVTPRPELDSVIGRLSPPQTSILGRFGITALSPLYDKVNGPYYRPT